MIRFLLGLPNFRVLCWISGGNTKMCLETWGRSQEDQWQSLHKKPAEAHPGCASEEEDRRTTITRLSSKVWEREVESPSLTTASCFSSTTCTQEPRCTLLTLKSVVTRGKCHVLEHDVPAVLIQLQLPCVPSASSPRSMASAGRSLLACSHQHQWLRAAESQVRTSYRTVWDPIIVSTHD